MKFSLPGSLNRFRLDRRANVAMITALCIIPLFGMLGFAIDYGVTLSNKTKLSQAADAAAITGLTTAKAIIDGGGTRATAIAEGQSAALASFLANTGRLAFATTLAPQITIVPQGQQLTVSVQYNTQFQNQFSSFIGIKNNVTSSTAVASAALKSYYQFIFVVDTSGSMAIGGTSSVINTLNANIGCAFACHDPNQYDGPDYRAIAKQNGWTLKIDYVNQAVQSFVSTLQAQSANIPSYYSIGIYNYSTNFNVALAPSVQNFAAAQTAAAAIDVDPVQTVSNLIPNLPLTGNYGWTTTTTALLSTLATLTNVGDGSSAASQKTYVIFLTDGIEDVPGNIIYGRGSDLTYTVACQAIQATGANMISILAPYPVIPGDNQFGVLVQPLINQVPSALQNNCATNPNTQFFQATDGPGIVTAVQTALANILQGQARLTQ